ncbi:unnamed protein product [Phaedon cochleariae]|uniref:Peptidase S1 domain-containing protein n=1 Tax=Phaedon cochleariae TaxID=80249 RepID=A0A9P0GMQ7_PHACE|nr:unnamed protein product [Phaedon cochleariae]
MHSRLLICALVAFSFLCTVFADDETAEEVNPEQKAKDGNTKSSPSNDPHYEAKRYLYNNPYYASIRYPINYQYCAGTMISYYYAMTASQCVNNQARPNMYAVMDLANFVQGAYAPGAYPTGRWPPSYGPGFGPTYPAMYPPNYVPGPFAPYYQGSLSDYNPNVYSNDLWCHWSQISGMYPHPDYVRSTGENDIALLKLQAPVPRGVFPQLPKRPYQGDLMRSSGACGKERSVISWFRKGDTKPVGYATQFDCSHAYSKRKFGESVMCTTSLGADTCHFESGAPMMCGKIVYGILSMGSGCNESSPGVFTRVDRHLKFIRGVIKPRSGAMGIRMSGAVFFIYFLAWCSSM